MSKLTKARHIFPRNIKIKLIILLAGIIIGAQIETLTLSVIQPFILVLTDPSVIYTNRYLSYLYNILGFGNAASFLSFLGICIATVYSLRGFYFYLFTRIQNRFIARNTVWFSNRILAQTLKQSYLYHVNHNVAELHRAVIKNVERLFALVRNILSMLADGFMSVFILAFLLNASPSMTLVVMFLASICIIVYFRIFRKIIKSGGEEEARGLVAINKSVLQTLHGIKEIKIMRKEAYFTGRFKNVSYHTVKNRERIYTLRQLPKLFIESLCFSGAFIIISVAVAAGVDMQELVPQLGMFVLAAFRLLPAISRLTTSIMQIIRLSSSIDQVFNGLFELDKEYSAPLREPNITVDSHDITVTNVTFGYPNMRNRKPVLKDVSFAIPKNTSIAFIGPSGAGKSTLIDILLGILIPQEGGVYFNGKSIHHNFNEWAKNIGYIPQTIYLLDETILENVAFGVDKGKIDEEKVWHALEQAQLKEYVLSLPKGLQTTVGDRGIRLSGGQRQRIGIARALYNDPPILVLDEATAALDNKTEKKVMQAIKGLQGSKTVVIVTHRLSTVAHCDVVYEVSGRTVKAVRSTLPL
jgi:ABC-type multidrug transport system fused ATPase/permease subunit